MLDRLGIERVNDSLTELELTSHDKFTSYTTDKKGNKVEAVIMFNDIEDQVAYQKLRNNIAYFIQDAIKDEEFRKKL